MAVLHKAAEADVTFVVEAHCEAGDLATFRGELGSFGAHPGLGGLVVPFHLRMRAQGKTTLLAEMFGLVQGTMVLATSSPSPPLQSGSRGCLLSWRGRLCAPTLPRWRECVLHL